MPSRAENPDPTLQRHPTPPPSNVQRRSADVGLSEQHSYERVGRNLPDPRGPSSSAVGSATLDAQGESSDFFKSLTRNAKVVATRRNADAEKVSRGVRSILSSAALQLTKGMPEAESIVDKIVQKLAADKKPLTKINARAQIWHFGGSGGDKNIIQAIDDRLASISVSTAEGGTASRVNRAGPPDVGDRPGELLSNIREHPVQSHVSLFISLYSVPCWRQPQRFVH